jgi:hypothetical protein
MFSAQFAGFLVFLVCCQFPELMLFLDNRFRGKVTTKVPFYIAPKIVSSLIYLGLLVFGPHLFQKSKSQLLAQRLCFPIVAIIILFVYSTAIDEDFLWGFVIILILAARLRFVKIQLTILGWFILQ